ncbi:MAG: hypothetical protein F6K17_32430 [Okeania sp. SIO3C4]|nr:hypothetical protein [Okeania sp. SIO3C4]
MEQTLAERKLKLIAQIIETESLELIEALENLLLEASFEQTMSENDKQLLNNNLQETQELEEHLEQRIAHHQANPEKASDAFEAITEIGKTHGYEL